MEGIKAYPKLKKNKSMLTEYSALRPSVWIDASLWARRLGIMCSVTCGRQVTGTVRMVFSTRPSVRLTATTLSSSLLLSLCRRVQETQIQWAGREKANERILPSCVLVCWVYETRATCPEEISLLPSNRRQPTLWASDCWESRASVSSHEASILHPT